MRILLTVVLTVLLVLITATIGFVAFFKLSFRYWKNKKLPFETPSIPFGTFKSVTLQAESLGESFQKCYHRAKTSGYKQMGLFAFWKPIYMPVDLKIIKSILTENFHYFVDRKVTFNEKDDPLMANLFTMDGNNWRNMRAKLTPTFSSGKMKRMFQSFVDCSQNLKTAMDGLSFAPIPFDAKEVMSCFTIDIIGCCAFGLECDSFKNPNSEFCKFGKMVLKPSLWQSLVAFFGFCSPYYVRRLGLRFLRKDVSDFFINITRQSIEYRKINTEKRNDFLQLLIDLQNESHDYHDSNKAVPGLTFHELAAQMFVFFIAGFETSSSTASFCLYELAASSEIQEKARNEVNSVVEAHGGKITYESVANMKYLNQVIDETLRKYPPVVVLNRSNVSDYTIPGTKDVIEKDTPVFISVLGLHRDADYYPDPDKFDPERFSDVNKPKIVPFTYLPFGEGPRNCIGLRFGKLQVKVALVVLLQNFHFSVNPKTKTPLEIDPKALTLSAKDGIWLDMKKL